MNVHIKEKKYSYKYKNVPGALSPQGNKPRHEANLSPLTSVEIKNTWIYTSTLPYVFMT
jgi:hypothetical protein